MEIHDRIRQALIARQKTEAEVMTAAQIAYTTWRDIISGVTKRPKKLPEIAEALNVSFQWLCFGVGTMDGESVGKVNEPAATYGEKVVIRRITGAHLSAGNGETIYDYETALDRSFDLDWMRSEGLEAEHCVLWTARGDSMYSTICDGEMVLVNMRQREPQDRKIFALITEDGMRLKRLIKKMDNSWEIRSDNEDKRLYPSEPYVPGQVAIMGRVRWHAGTL